VESRNCCQITRTEEVFGNFIYCTYYTSKFTCASVTFQTCYLSFTDISYLILQVYLIDWAGFIFADLFHLRYLKTEFMSFEGVGILCKLVIPEEAEGCGYDGDRKWDDIVSRKFIYCMKDKFVSLQFLNKTTVHVRIYYCTYIISK